MYQTRDSEKAHVLIKTKQEAIVFLIEMFLHLALDNLYLQKTFSLSWLCQ